MHTKLESSEDERKVFEERQIVVNQDNDELKSTVRSLQQELKTAKSKEVIINVFFCKFFYY